MPILEDDAMMVTLKKAHAGIKNRQKGMGQMSDAEAKLAAQAANKDKMPKIGKAAGAVSDKGAQRLNKAR